MEPEKTFKPAATVICPHCQGQNMNWRIVYSWCNKDIEADADVMISQEKSA